MKKHIDELDGPRLSWLLIFVKSLIVLATIGIAVCVCLVPVFAVVKIVAAIDGFFASLFSGLSTVFCWILLPIAVVALCLLFLGCTGGEIAWPVLAAMAAMLAWLLFGILP